MRSARVCSATIPLIAGIGCIVSPAPVFAENWRLSASASATETYTSNANYSISGLAEGDFVTSFTGSLQIHGEGARVKLNGTISGTVNLYAGQSQNNSFGPQVNLAGTLEAIEKFAYLDAQASVSQTFISPFGAQPADLVNATQNRYTQQTYVLSPYIQGRLGSTDVSYSVRDDNLWTVASDYGNSSSDVPNTYANALSASLTTAAKQGSWELTYNRLYYDNGFASTGNAVEVGAGATTTQIARLIVTYQIDPQIQIAPRIGYEKNDFPLRSTSDVVYGIGGQWSPGDRTQVGGFWEHRFFGSSYQLNISHRLPRAALGATFSRGLSSYPQLALAIPAGAAVSQFVDAAFRTRIPDSAERAAAVAQFLANSGLPPTLASPVDFYSTSVTLQQSANVSLVLIGAFNSISFSLFHVKSEAISAAGNVLPPALQFGQNNTQTGGGVTVSHRLSGFTNITANATYSTTTANATTGPIANTRSNNGSASVSLTTSFGPKTTGGTGVSFSQSRFSGADLGTVSSLNVFASITHTF
ncbi:MAG: TIGR03016 family PEP-CTERM system-associated outer membrane protein [Vicinamibacterales bacterium]